LLKAISNNLVLIIKEVFALIVCHDTIRLVIAIAAQNKCLLINILYMWKKGNKNVYKLKKALYGLKQAPRAGYSHIEAYFLKEEAFTSAHMDIRSFSKVCDRDKMIIVCLYVDDLIFTGSDVAMFNKFKESMMSEFDMTDIGILHYFLGIEVV